MVQAGARAAGAEADGPEGTRMRVMGAVSVESAPRDGDARMTTEGEMPTWMREWVSDASDVALVAKAGRETWILCVDGAGGIYARRLDAGAPPPPSARSTADVFAMFRDAGPLPPCRASAKLDEWLGPEASYLFSMDGGIIQWAKKVDPSMPIY